MRRRLALAALLLMPALAQAQDGPVCIYNSQSFSEGAGICVQRHLMMNCTVTDHRAVWKIVGDRDLSRLCAGPSRSTAQRASPPRRQLARRVPAPAASGDAKCFNFNGRRFCE